METNVAARYLGAHSKTIRTVQWSVDGSQIASGGTDNKINIYFMSLQKVLLIRCLLAI